MSIVKGQVYTFNSARGSLNGVKYTVIRTGAKTTTLEPVHGQPQLIGLPLSRQPFQIKTADLIEAIQQGIYTV